MNIKEFFHKKCHLESYGEEVLVSECIFSKDILHKNFESFEKAFDVAISKNFKILHYDDTVKLRVGFMVVNGKNVASHFIKLSTFKKAGMLEKMLKNRKR